MDEFSGEIGHDFIKNNDGPAIAQRLASMPYTEISNGFPVDTAQKLYSVMQYYMQAVKVNRFPIIGTTDGKIYILTQPHEMGMMSHLTLFERLKIPEEAVEFTTCLENVRPKRGNLYKPYLQLDLETKKYFIELDTIAAKFKPGLTEKGREKIKALFEKIEGVHFLP